jgi:hypothetical protein
MLPSAVAENAAHNSYLVYIVMLVFDYLILSLICYAFVNRGKNVSEIFTNNFGKVLTKIFLSLYVLLFAYKIAMFTVEQRLILASALYRNIEYYMVIAPLFLLAIYMVLKGGRAFARSADFYFWVVLSSLIIILILAFNDFEFANFLPFLSTGFSETLRAGIKHSLWFSDSLILLIFLNELKQERGVIRAIKVSYLISAALTAGFIILFINLYGPTAQFQASALARVTKYNLTLSIIGSFGWVPIFLTLIGSVLYVCMLFYGIVVFLGYIFNTKKVLTLCVITFTALFIIPYIMGAGFQNIYDVYEGGLRYIFYIPEYVVPALTALTAASKKFSERSAKLNSEKRKRIDAKG